MFSFLRRFRVTPVLLLPTLLVGCFSPFMAIPGRSAIDQQVTAEAIRAAVNDLELEGLPEGTFEVRVSAPREADVDWVAACARDRLSRDGHRVADKGKSTHTFEVTVAHAASDLEQTLIGIPLFIPGVPVAFGDISLYKSNTLTGRARLGAHVYDRSGRLTLLVPETQESRFFKNESFFTFIGAFIRTDVDEFVEPGDEDPERGSELDE